MPLLHQFRVGMGRNIMLKMTKIELELMTGVDMFQFIEKGCEVV